MGYSWGRFTVYGSTHLEQRLTSLIEGVNEVCEPILTPECCRAMVLFGGYGRGEGGVEIVEDGGASGTAAQESEQPHNNLDFLIITQPGLRQESGDLKSEVYQALQPLRDKFRIEMDLALISASKLCREPSLVMWYDMRFGHKCVLGDRSFLESLHHFSVENIPAWDVRNLLVNRGTLLLINDYLLAETTSAFDPARTVVKHAMKAIIGYGDALLYFLGAYHWSYQEKQRRMRDVTQIPPRFKALYDEAIEFRFRPRYSAYVHRDLRSWMETLREAFAPIYLQCESARLNCGDFDWERYPNAALSGALMEERFSPRAWAKKCYYSLRKRGRAPKGSLVERLGYQCIGPRGRMALAFPAVAFDIQSPHMRSMAVSALDAKSGGIDDLRRAYLIAWNKFGDTNFGSFLRNCNLKLEQERRSA
jgi:hypothetical protein